DLVCITTAAINFTNYSFITVLKNTGNDGNGTPQFTATHYWVPFLGVRPITVGDLNGDGWADVIIGTSGGIVQVWMNNGSGAFTANPNYFYLQPTNGGSVGPGVIADLNGDGNADYVVTDNQN